MNNTHQIGVKALFRTSGIEFDGKRKITSSFIGYTIAPRINAAGRIGDASQAVRLFLSKTSGEADAIAEELCATNRERQSTENQIYIEAIEQIEKNHDLSKENVIVLSSDTWHHGVIGIVASRLTERYNLPSVLISFDGSGESGIGKGSARSVKGLNLVKALAACEDTLCKYGGHELAAGLTVERSRLSEFSERLNTYIGENKDNDSIRNVTVIDSEIESTDINEFTVNAISGLEPFGAGNPVPVFIYKDATIVSLIELSMGKHTKLIIEKDGIVSQAVCFGNNLKKEGFCEGDIIDIVCNMDINEFRGVRNIQFVVRDIDYSDEYKSELSFKQYYIDKLFYGEIKPDPDELPCKDDLSAIYSSMKSMLPSGKGNITIKKLVAQHSSV